jgi:hypothetical protein
MGSVLLSAGQVVDRRHRLIDFLDAWGDLHVRDLGGDRDVRLLELTLEAPGHDLPVEVRAQYGESYRRRRDARWHLAGYRFEYHDLARALRLAYHLHEVGSNRPIPHAHCGAMVEPQITEGSHHLRAVELDLREAHMIFMRLYASDTAPDCSTFLPLEIDRDAQPRPWSRSRGPRPT